MSRDDELYLNHEAMKTQEERQIPGNMKWTEIDELYLNHKATKTQEERQIPGNMKWTEIDELYFEPRRHKKSCVF